MVGLPAKPPKTVEGELPVQAIDQDPKVKAFKDTLDFPSIDSFLDFDSCNWLGNNRNTEEFSIEDTDFDFFEDDMEIGQKGATVSEETRPENQTTVISETVEAKSKLCSDSFEEIGVSSIRSESMIKVRPELYGDVSEDIGAIKSESMVEVEPKLCDDMSANFNCVAEAAVKESEPVVSDNSKPMEGETVSVACSNMNLDESETELKKTDGGLASSIEVGLEKVSLTMDDDEKADGAKGKANAADSESETSSSSSDTSDSSSSSGEEDSDEEEDKKVNKFGDPMVMGEKDDVAGELEEGEIESVDEEHEGDENEVDDDDDDDDDDEVNEMIAWSNDEDDDLGLQTKEPIRSKNELKELPPVPAVEVSLEPHHATLPVGVVLSVMSAQVIVEGMEKHSPLSEGSILWITERRTPLGLVDEIFGPVKCPYYIVRFNSESEVPEGVCQGTPVSFVADYAQHILNIKELQKKGYDASGDNDEEISEELEFSDDEKEAEYRRMQKMEKRGMMSDPKTGYARNKKKKNRDQGRPTSSYSGEWTENQGSSSLSSNRSDPQMSGPVSNHQPRPPMDCFPPNGGAWRPQSNQQNQYQLPPIPNQMGMHNLPPMQIPFMAMQNQNQNQMMFQPQFHGGQMPMPGGPGGFNFFQGQGPAPWPALVGQNCFNQQQPFGMGRGIQQPQLQNDLNFNMFASQGFQMQRPQSQMNPQFQMQPQFQNHQQAPMNPQFQMLNRPPQSPMNPQFQMQPQSETRPQSQSPTNPQSPMQPESQGFRTGESSERGRGHRGRGRGRGRGRFGRGRGRGRGRQQSE
uniref:H/ACA ribonucleoprotein complex non-core subunit NAF1 n=1 Tax=Noccaea caerulescens TaxID=107243 RepID=A0A1J3FRP9_NOCCA